MFKITVIGAGSVGATVAYTLAVQELASEIVMIDVNFEKALGEAMDIRQGMPFCGPVQVYAGNYADAVDSNVVIITSGLPRKAGQSRLDLAQANVGVIKEVTDNIVKYAPNAIYIIVANPVDVLTYAFHKFSGLPEKQIIGSGTVLDTARLRSRLSDCFHVSQQNVHAFVWGEHGDTSFVPWSIANVAGMPINDFADAKRNSIDALRDFNCEDVENYIRTSGAKVIKRKGATFYAVSLAVCNICKCIAYSTETLLTVSTMFHGEYGINDVCLSGLTEVGKNGHGDLLTPEITSEEEAKLRRSADALRAILDSVNI